MEVVGRESVPVLTLDVYELWGKECKGESAEAPQRRSVSVSLDARFKAFGCILLLIGNRKETGERKECVRYIPTVFGFPQQRMNVTY